MSERTKLRILLVDDEELIRRLLSLSFGNAGYAVRSAASGREALDICEYEIFDAVLSDVRMPGEINGHELIKAIRQRDPNIPCVLMSGFDELLSDGCAEAEKPSSFLAKPFRPNEAVAVVNALVGQFAIRAVSLT